MGLTARVVRWNHNACCSVRAVVGLTARVVRWNHNACCFVRAAVGLSVSYRWWSQSVIGGGHPADWSGSLTAIVLKRTIVFCKTCFGGGFLMLLQSILGCVLPRQEVALRQSPPSFSVLCCPCPYRPLLPHKVISLPTFWAYDLSHALDLLFCASDGLTTVLQSGNVSGPFPFRMVMSVTQVICLMMVLRILSFSLTFSIFLSMARWLVSSFFINAFVRGHV